MLLHLVSAGTTPAVPRLWVRPSTKKSIFGTLLFLLKWSVSSIEAETTLCRFRMSHREATIFLCRCSICTNLSSNDCICQLIPYCCWFCLWRSARSRLFSYLSLLISSSSSRLSASANGPFTWFCKEWLCTGLRRWMFFRRCVWPLMKSSLANSHLSGSIFRKP